MVHHKLLNKIRGERVYEDFLYPYYNGYSIAEIGASIETLFGKQPQRPALQLENIRPRSKQKIIMLMIDGFSYFHFVKNYKRLPFLKKFGERGDVYPITSVFPSTTPAALTTIHTGLTPQEHGLPEWNVYFVEFDRIIETLPFKTWDMSESDGLLKQGGNRAMLYEGTTVYQRLQEQGIKSYTFVYKDYSNSAYSTSVHSGSQVVPYAESHDMFNSLIDLLHKDEGPTYYFVYWPKIDSVAHQYGPDSNEHLAAIEYFATALEEQFIHRVDPTIAKQSLLLMTADHGHSNIKKDDIINLNKYPAIEKNFMVGPQGRKILPTGSPHDVFLFIQPEKIKEVMDFLTEELRGMADVITTEEALKAGLFGLNQPNPKFIKRIGNVLILPYKHYHVWYEFLPDAPFHFLGIHGGLSEEEMIVPFGIVELQRLQESTE